MKNPIVGNDKYNHAVPHYKNIVIFMQDPNCERESMRDGTSIWKGENGLYYFANHNPFSYICSCERVVLLGNPNQEEIYSAAGFTKNVGLVGIRLKDDPKILFDNETEILWDSKNEHIIEQIS